MDILEVHNLTKNFGNFTAVDNISFSLREGEILGILGQNGAGKTTTIQMLLGVLRPSSGTINYFGKDLQNNREEILEEVNFSSAYTNLPWNLTVKENLTYISYLYDIKNRVERIKRIVEVFRLYEIFNKQIRSLSAGQITRVNLAKAFINFPKVLLLDEPTASLDPEVAKHIRDFLMEERKKFQVSIIITSHNMVEVEEICDRVLFIDKGKIIADDTPDNLAKTIEICHVNLLIKDGLKRLEDYCEEQSLAFKIDARHIIVDVKEKKLGSFLIEITNSGIIYDEISIDKPTLEDYFLGKIKITQKHENT
ncbi:MAG: ABC transporter ATP-binding protein [Candidatus Roizmanbacteria bacterium]|nr:MAG: ABC transporter ATP-binding protein [Candidatus Roizmanbacteria bacterium]